MDLLHTNEFWFLLIVAVSYALVLGSYAISRQALMVFFSVFYVILLTAGMYTSEVFGVFAATGSIMYAGSFLVTDIMAEKYGRSEARKYMYIQLAVSLLIPLLSWLALQATPIEASIERHEQLQHVFSNSFRISIAMVATIAIAQNFDIWLFHFIKKITGEKHLWLRNNLSTAVSQFMDSFIFWGIAMYGIAPNLWQIILSAYVIKLIAAAIDTPFIYLVKKITPLDERK